MSDTHFHYTEDCYQFVPQLLNLEITMQIWNVIVSIHVFHQKSHFISDQKENQQAKHSSTKYIYTRNGYDDIPLNIAINEWYI